MSETMPINYYEQAQLNLARNLILLEEYNNLTAQIKTAGLELLQSTQVSNLSRTSILEKSKNSSLQSLKSELQATGDAMIFGPIDWIMYKNQTKQNMETLGDLVAHCQNGDIICPLRFSFFKTKWNELFNFGDINLNTPLLDFIHTSQFQAVVCNDEFDSLWWSNERNKDEQGNTAKWGVGYKY